MARKESYKQLMGKWEEKEPARPGDGCRSFWKTAGVRFSTRWRHQYATYTTCSAEVSLAVSESTSTSSRAR